MNRPGHKNTSFGRAAQRREAGFSLVEVLCAVLILGVALVGLTQGITTALRSNKDSELQTTAAVFAAGMIEALRADTGLENGSEEGECGPGLTEYKWSQVIRGTELDGLREVSVTVLHASTGKEIYTIQTMLFEIPSEPLSKSSDQKKRSRARGGRS